MSTFPKNYNLSYMCGSVTWDGKSIQALPAEQISSRLDLLQSVGISEVMLTGYHCEEPISFDADAETKRLGDELRARGMKAAQHHALCSTWALDDDGQREVVRRMRKIIDWSANLAADAVVIHNGKSLEPCATFDDIENHYAAACAAHGESWVRDRMIANLREAGKYAEEKGVFFAIENIPQHPIGSFADLPDFIDEVDMPYVGHCLDTGHSWYVGVDPVKWVRRLGRKILTVHVHDNLGPDNPFPKHKDEHLPPGFGTIPWRPFISALHEVGWDRTINFESGGWPGMPEAEGLRHAIDFWRSCENII